MKNYGKVKTALMGRLSELKKKKTTNQLTTSQFRKLLVTLTVPTCPCIYIHIWIFCLHLCVLHCTLQFPHRSQMCHHSWNSFFQIVICVQLPPGQEPGLQVMYICTVWCWYSLEGKGIEGKLPVITELAYRC